jgi:tetratricopeptide (TPR) repeat protein
MPKGKKVIKQTAKGKDIQQVAGDLVIKTSEDIELIFEEAVGLINKGDARTSQVLLEGLWKRHNDKMTPRQKSNCKRLTGCSFDRQDKPEDAGRCFLEAKDHDPTWEKARAFEAVGYLCLGDPVKAYELAEAVIKDFSQNSIAWSVWVRTARHSLTFQQIRNKLPAHIQDDAEVSMGLAERAAVEGNYNTAEQYMAKVDKSVPSNPRVTEKLGYLLVDRAKVNEHILHQRGPTAQEKNYLEKAEAVLTDALNRWQKEQSKLGAVRVLLRRAWVRKVLLKHDQAKDDIREAYHIAPEDPQTVFWYAVALSEQSLDDAITLLKKIVGSGYAPDVEFLLVPHNICF